MDKLPRRDLKILMGDLNAKVGANNTNRELGKAKSRKTETDLAQEYRRRGEGHRNDMGAAEEDLTESSALEECCCGPMFLRESKGLSN